jgi:hypothetical protein
MMVTGAATLGPHVRSGRVAGNVSFIALDCSERPALAQASPGRLPERERVAARPRGEGEVQARDPVSGE